MAFWRSMLGLVTGAGYRQQGLQSGTPGYYSSNVSTTVTFDSAMQLSAVWASIKLITESVASLPINIYNIDQSGIRRLDLTNPISRLFAAKPNRWQTRQEFFETMLYQKVALGNAYAHIDRNPKGEIIQLTPLMSQQMQVTLLNDGSITYRYTNGNNQVIYSDKSIWHLKLFGNGIIGLSPLEYARNSIGIGQGAETSVSKIYANGGKPSGALMIDKLLTKEQRAQIKESFREMAEGENSRLFTLEAGMKYEQISLSPQDIELLASRRFQIEDIARFFGVPSALINDTSSTTAWGSGIQQIVEGFYKLALRPYLTRIESSIKNNLFLPGDRTKIEVEFDFNELVQPFLAERIKSYKEAVTGAIISPNEARVAEGWDKKDGGDELYMQQQMIPLGKLATADFTRGKANENISSNT